LALSLALPLTLALGLAAPAGPDLETARAPGRTLVDRQLDRRVVQAAVILVG